jgi:hypothetical protein
MNLIQFHFEREKSGQKSEWDLNGKDFNKIGQYWSKFQSRPCLVLIELRKSFNTLKRQKELKCVCFVKKCIFETVFRSSETNLLVMYQSRITTVTKEHFTRFILLTRCCNSRASRTGSRGRCCCSAENEFGSVPRPEQT